MDLVKSKFALSNICVFVSTSSQFKFLRRLSKTFDAAVFEATKLSRVEENIKL